jgi:hypothetical protein
MRKQQMTHPDSDVLAEFCAGLVTGRRGARISAHLASCERCAGVCDQLTEVSVLLAAVPVPAVPDALAQRLEDVLAVEAAQRHDSERAVDPRLPDRAASRPPRRHWDFRLVALRVLAPAAAVAVVAAAGYGLSRVTGSSSSSSAASGTVAAPAASSAQAVSSARAGAAAVPSNPGVGRPGMTPQQIEGPAAFGVVTSQTDYHRATLTQQLESELQRYALATGTPRELAAGPLRGCVVRVTHGVKPGNLVLVERARFQGRPAIVIVAMSGNRYAAWVTTSSCSGTSDNVLATATLAGTSAL